LNTETNNLDDLLLEAGIKPTSNRITVLRELLASPRPQSLAELESNLATLEKSSILRVLSLLLEHHLVHAVEDGRGIVKYEICHSKDKCSINDMHVHFYCTACQQVYCFEGIPVPLVELPAGFSVDSVNYMLKGLCSNCKDSKQR